MDQNKFNQVIKAVNSLNDFMVEGHLDYDKVGKKAKQFMKTNYGSNEPIYESIQQEELAYIEEAYQEQVNQKKQNKKKVKQTKNKKDKDKGNEEQIQKYRLHQQELDFEQEKLRKQEENNLDYWREAILLSEVIGSPVAKRRRAKRMERR